MARRNKIIFLSFFLLLLFFFALELKAQNLGDSFGSELEKITNVTGYERIANPNEKLSIYVGGLLGWTGVLGVVMLAHIVMAGYEFMTAHGNEEKIDKAKRRIRSFIIAAIILVGGLIIATFVTYLFSTITDYGG